MARITVEDCLKEVGQENRFSLIHLAIQRLHQHREGQPFLAEGKNKEVVMTLREIAAGKITPENIKEFWRLQQELEAGLAAEETAKEEETQEN